MLKISANLELFIAEDNKTRLEIIFRGSSGGKRISKSEKEQYHKGVDVFWQANAWADTPFSVEWVNTTLKPATATFDENGKETNEEFLLIVDNLKCQIKEEFKTAVKKINGLVWYGISSKSDVFFIQ